VPITKNRKKSKPQSPWLRREVLTKPSDSPKQEPSQDLPLPLLIGRHEVCALVGASYPTIWAAMRNGTFPRSRIHGGKSKWLTSEITDWAAALPVRRLKGDAP
jgi:predicted DNA-binding transcriptional regulator AlpA